MSRGTIIAAIESGLLRASCAFSLYEKDTHPAH